MAEIYQLDTGRKVGSIYCKGCGSKKKPDDMDDIYPLADPRGHPCYIELNKDREINWHLYKSGWWEVAAKEKRPNRTKREWYYYKSLWYCSVCAHSSRMPRTDSPREVLEHLFASKVLQSDFSALRDFRWWVRMFTRQPLKHY